MRTSALLALALLCPCIALAADCSDRVPDLSDFYSTSWGITADNHRLQQDTSLDRASVGKLALAWSYGLANNQPRFWPLVTPDTVFIGDSGRGIVALDRRSGCERWVLEIDGAIASAISPATIGGEPALVFALRQGGIRAVSAVNGQAIWQTAIDDQPIPFYSGSPMVTDDTVLVPISSLEIGVTANPLYGCCSTSGGMAAFDLDTGAKRWFLPTIMQPAEVTGKRWFFIEMKGPSGAPVWGAPAHDPATNTVYYGTGQNYSHPTTDTSDAIFAVDVETGEPRWIRQFTEGDAYNISCNLGGPNCPQPMGPDIDFGAPPLLINAGNRQLLIAAQKSSDIHAMDARTGEVIWQTRIGRGGALGGVHWGIAADQQSGTLFIPVSDVEAMPGSDEPRPGMFALDAATGELKWEYVRDHKCATERCASGFSAAITTTPQVLFAGSLDGVLEAIDTGSGDVLWSFDTKQDFTAVNGIETRGGSIDAHGPMVAGDQVFLSSGYGTFGQQPGNAFLVFALEEERP